MDRGAENYRRFLDGDESAFDAIMEEIFPALVFFLNGYVQDFHTAEDLAMDAFAELLVHRHRYNFKVMLKTYVFMIGRSRALDYLRRRKILAFVPIGQAESCGTEDPLVTVVQRERNRRLYAVLRELPEGMREAVYLVYLQGLSYEQAAKIMRKTVKQVDNYLYRAKKIMGEKLGEEAFAWR